MKKILISMMMLSIIFLGGCTNRADDREVWEVSADWIGFETQDEMAEYATDVVRAKVLSSTVERRRAGDDDYWLYTVYTIRILEVFQGDLQIGDEIELAQMGGESETEVMISSGWIPIETGDDLVLFLLTYPGFSAGFFLQGVYRLSEALEATQVMDATIELIPLVREGRDSLEESFDLTVEDLWALAAGKQVWEVSTNKDSYGSVEELAEKATDVVRAEIMTSWEEREADVIDEESGLPRAEIYTIYIIQILEVFQGDLQVGDELRIMQMGGRRGNIEVVNLDGAPIQIGDDLVMFLYFPSGADRAEILNPWQGVYRLSTEIARDEKMDATIELIPAAEGRHRAEFTITVEDLWNLAGD